MIEKHLKIVLAAAAFAIAYMQSTSAYMNPGMTPIGMNPMNPYGYHVARKRRHRNFFQRLTGTGRRYKYYVKPNSYMTGMNPMYRTPGMMMNPVGTTTVMNTTASYGMGTGMGIGNKMGMGMTRNGVRSTSALSHACRSDDTNSLRQVNCPYMSQHDLHYCFTRASDPFLTALVNKCKGIFTSNPYQMAAYGVELILANKSMPFGKIITRSTCKMLGSYELKTLLRTAIVSHTPDSYAFVDYILNTCHIPTYLLTKFQGISLMTGEMSVAMRLQHAAMYPVSHRHVQMVFFTPSGRAIDLSHDGALALMTGRDMAMFGKIGRGCSQLRPEHITHPLFNSELLSEMSENCFKHLSPRLFWYMTSDMIKRFRWWRSATPAQMRWIPLGKPMQAVPFFLLGQHAYVNKLDRHHPCAGITKTQRISVQMEPKTARAFYERCRASSAFAVKASLSVLISAMVGYFVFLS